MSLYTREERFDNQTMSAVIDGLKPFTNYSFYVTTTNNIGIGLNGAHAFCRTGEDGI